MKHLLSILLVATLPSVASADLIGVYSDPSTVLCSVHDDPGPKTLYVVHKFSLGSFGSRFRVEYSSGFTGTLVGFSSSFASVSGNPAGGATVMYDNVCQAGTFQVMTLSFMLYGGSPTCSWVRVAPTSVQVYTCGQQWQPADWEGTHVTPGSGGPNCPNDLPYEEHTHFCRPYWEPTIPTAESTWGAVKALYR